MTGRPDLHVVGGGAPEDPVVRKRRFEAQHPEAAILPPAAGRWRAVVPPGDNLRTTLGAWSLAELMDQLDDIYPQGNGERRDHSG